MVTQTTDFLFDYVLPAADDYLLAENQLSQAFVATGTLTSCQLQVNHAVRRACEVAVAIDSLVDRAHIETGQPMATIRSSVDKLCVIGSYHRQDALARVSAAANTYKHLHLTNPRHPISSFGNVLAVGAGFGVDGYGIGKFSGVEVILTQNNGLQRKFLGDVPYSIRGWLSYLNANGANLPNASITVCQVQVWP